MVEVETDAALAEALAARADVSGVEANLRRACRGRTRSKVRGPRRAPPSGIEPNLVQVRAPELWARGATGQGIVLGSADTGFDWEHAALRAHYRGWDGANASHAYNWHDAIHDARAGNPCGSDAPAPCDDDGHGTETSGLMVGDDGGENRIGVAPGARLIGCRNMDGGNGTPARYTECFEWFLAPTDAAGEHPRPDLGADVINNSWGCPASEGCTSPDILKGVVENVRAAGIAVVVAAGNSGGGSGPVLPACSTVSDVPSFYDAATTVGAIDATDAIAGFSSIGPVLADGSNRLKPDLVAPGVSLRSCARGGAYAGGLSGTSAAAPHVAGAIALLWSALPWLVGDVDSDRGGARARGRRPDGRPDLRRVRRAATSRTRSSAGAASTWREPSLAPTAAGRARPFRPAAPGHVASPSAPEAGGIGVRSPPYGHSRDERRNRHAHHARDRGAGGGRGKSLRRRHEAPT